MKNLNLVLILTLCMLGNAHAMQLQVAGVQSGGTLPEETVFNSFGCSGGNISPEITWTGVPKGAKSLAFDIYDPDAPTGSGWWHWIVVNIPANATGLPKGAGSPNSTSLPKGALQIRTDYNAPGYGGPCPPPGDKPHRYIFTLHALKVDKLPLTADIPAAMAGYNVKANEITHSSFTAKYGRPAQPQK